MDHQELDRLIKDFLDVARISGFPLSQRQIEFRVLSAPHRQPSRLPAGKKAIYVFSAKDCYLKVGKAGPNTQARFTSQHYNSKSTKSNLAKSMLKSKALLKSRLPSVSQLEIDQLSEQNVKSWIEDNTTRYHFS
ncbi:hypothetical protein ACFLU8_00145 [Chloroflexota bacterium]